MAFFDPLKLAVQNTLTRVGNFIVPKKPATPQSLFTQTNPKPVAPITTGILQPKLTVPVPKPLPNPPPKPSPAFLSKGTSAQVVGPQPAPVPSPARTSTLPVAPPKAVSQGLFGAEGKKAVEEGVRTTAKVGGAVGGALAPKAIQEAREAKTTGGQIVAGAKALPEIGHLALREFNKIALGLGREAANAKNAFTGSNVQPEPTFTPQGPVQKFLLGEEPVSRLGKFGADLGEIGTETLKSKELLGEKAITGEDTASKVKRAGYALPLVAVGGILEGLGADLGIGGPAKKLLKETVENLAVKYGREVVEKVGKKELEVAFKKGGKEGVETLVHGLASTTPIKPNVAPIVGQTTLPRSLETQRQLITDEIRYKQKAGEKLTPVEQAVNDAGGMRDVYTGDAKLPKPVEPTPIGVADTPETAYQKALAITSPSPKANEGLVAKGKGLLTSAKQKADIAYDNFVSRFEPLARAETEIFKARNLQGPELSMAKKMELLAGSAGKAEADAIPFEKEVMNKIRDEQDDFNVFLFSKRAEDRLFTDAKGRAVGRWTREDANKALEGLRRKIGDKRFAEYEQIGQKYQEIMDKSLQLQVESGRMTPEIYQKIKGMNDFYAPYKVLKYLEGDSFQPVKEGIAGSGRDIANTSDLTKAITGITSEKFGIADILNESMKSIYKSRILAEKARIMQSIAKLAPLDTEGAFIKKAKPTRHFMIEQKPAEDILHQLNMQYTQRNTQTLDQSFIKVGRAIQLADEVGIPVTKGRFRNSGTLGRATLGGIDTGGKVKLQAFTSDVIAHELSHIFDAKTGEFMPRLSQAGMQPEFRKELKTLIDYTAPFSPKGWKAQGVEKFAEFLNLFIHDPAKARELAPLYTEFFEKKLLPENKVKVLVGRLADFYQKVDKLPNIKSKLDEMGGRSYLDTAIRRAFPEKTPQLGISYGSKAREGYEVIEYLDGGVKKAIEVRKDIANAIHGMNEQQVNLFQTALSKFAAPFRTGATAANVAFQTVNATIYDPRRLAQMSRYGVKHPGEMIRFTLDLVDSVATSLLANVGGRKNELYEAFLKSGAANSTLQKQITPSMWASTLGRTSFKKMSLKDKAKTAIGTILDSPSKIGNALEEGTKITGFRRGLRAEGLKPSDVGLEANRELTERIASEVRNYAGSPDFARRGSQSVTTNLLFMFSNARIQGTDADMRRMLGMTGKEEMKAAWTRYMATTGIATTYLGVVNRLPGNKEDYDKQPKWRKDNYFLIPRNSYTTNDEGEKVRDYWQIPKREMDQYLSNVLDSFYDFAFDRDPKSFTDAGMSVVEGMSPVSVSGRNFGERIQSVVSSMNPILKVPIEQGFNVDTFRHTPIVNQTEAKRLPQDQYKPSTNPVYVNAGQALGVSPLKLQAASRGFFAGGLDQFIPSKPQGTQSKVSTLPVVSRFMSSPTVDNTEFYEKGKELEQKSASNTFKRQQEAEDAIESFKGMPQEEKDAKWNALKASNPALVKEILSQLEDKKLGLTDKETYIKRMPVADGSRAEYVIWYIRSLKLDKAGQAALYAELQRKKVISAEVDKQIREKLTVATP